MVNRIVAPAPDFLVVTAVYHLLFHSARVSVPWTICVSSWRSPGPDFFEITFAKMCFW